MSAAPQKNAIFYENNVQNGTVKSVFAHLDSLVYAIDKLKKSGVGEDDLVVTTPLPRHDVEHAIYGGKPSPIRWFTLTGALFGGTMGFSLCSFTHLNWAMIIPAGKPLVSIPAFMVITFESTVLWGCMFTLVGLLLMCRLPAKNLQIEIEDPRLSDDKFALVVNNLSRKKAEKIAEILRTYHAMEVIDGYTQEKGHSDVVVIPLEDRGIEPDETNNSLLAQLAIAMTIIIIASVVGVKFYFDTTLASELKKKNYTYTHRAVAPSYRTNK